MPEFNNGVKTGFLVGRDVVGPDQPQNFLGGVKINYPKSLREPRPGTSLQESRGLLGRNPFCHDVQFMQSDVGTVIIPIN